MPNDDVGVWQASFLKFDGVDQAHDTSKNDALLDFPDVVVEPLLEHPNHQVGPVLEGLPGLEVVSDFLPVRVTGEGGKVVRLADLKTHFCGVQIPLVHARR